MRVAGARARVDRVADGGAAEAQRVVDRAGHRRAWAASILASESELLSLRMSGIWPANLAAPASRKPSGAA